MVGAQYATLTLSSGPDLSSVRFFLKRNILILYSLISHSVEITSWIRYLSFFTV